MSCVRRAINVDLLHALPRSSLARRPAIFDRPVKCLSRPEKKKIFRTEILSVLGPLIDPATVGRCMSAAAGRAAARQLVSLRPRRAERSLTAARPQ